MFLLRLSLSGDVIVEANSVVILFEQVIKTSSTFLYLYLPHPPPPLWWVLGPCLSLISDISVWFFIVTPDDRRRRQPYTIQLDWDIYLRWLCRALLLVGQHFSHFHSSKHAECLPWNVEESDRRIEGFGYVKGKIMIFRY